MTRAFPLFHWSPRARRPAIVRHGLRPGMLATDGLWRPPFVCYAADPVTGWDLSGGTLRGREHPLWDLWQTWSDVPAGYEEILDHYPDTGREYVKEYRVYERLWKRDVTWVAERRQ